MKISLWLRLLQKSDDFCKSNQNLAHDSQRFIQTPRNARNCKRSCKTNRVLQDPRLPKNLTIILIKAFRKTILWKLQFFRQKQTYPASLRDFSNLVALAISEMWNKMSQIKILTRQLNISHRFEKGLSSAALSRCLHQLFNCRVSKYLMNIFRSMYPCFSKTTLPISTT